MLEENTSTMPLSKEEICKAARISPATAYNSLQRLKQFELVEEIIDGRYHRYKLKPIPVFKRLWILRSGTVLATISELIYNKNKDIALTTVVFLVKDTLLFEELYENKEWRSIVNDVKGTISFVTLVIFC